MISPPLPVMLVTVLASKLGWAKEDCWMMSYAAALNYLHALMISNGSRTRWAKLTEDERSDVEDEISNVFDVK